MVLVARALAGALLFGEKVIVLSAHEQKTSRVLFANLLSYFESFNDLSKRVRSVGRALGREEIWLRDCRRTFSFRREPETHCAAGALTPILPTRRSCCLISSGRVLSLRCAARPNACGVVVGTCSSMVGDGP